MTINNIIKHCSGILQNGKCSHFPYHNLGHTQEVIDKVYLISKALGIQPKEVNYIVIAACFHDTGFLETYDGHEEVSKRMAKQFLETANYSKAEIDKVCSYIDATKMPQMSSDIHAEVLCDADLFHLGTTDFYDKSLLLRKEWELFYGLIMNDSEWQQVNIQFLEEHKFKTTYGKEVLEKGKQENLSKLKQLIQI